MVIGKNPLYVLSLIIAIYGAIAAHDAADYYRAVNDTHTCCSWVSENKLMHPVIYAKTNWSKPNWHSNASGNMLWLTSDGSVDGRVVFWRVLDEKPNPQYNNTNK